MKKGLILIIYGILLAVIAALTSCRNTVLTTTQVIATSTITVPETTYTRTVNATEVRNFLSGLKTVYSQNNAPGAEPLNSHINGISEADLLSLTFQNDSVISMGGVSYNYVTINPISNQWMLPAEVKLNNYQIDFTIPNVTTTGGTPVSVQIFNGGNTGVPFGTTFIFYYIPFVINTASVYVERHIEQDLQFLFMLYNPPSSSQSADDLWLMLQPAQ